MRAPAVLALALLLAGAVPTGGAAAQCMLANPSFEVAGSGTTFGGWNQFGSVGSSTVVAHGAKAARVTTPGSDWGVSGFWQGQDTSPGTVWNVSAWVLVPSSRPLTGQSQAIVNIEWRDAGGNLISYESHTAATAATITDRYQQVSFPTQPAPAGTASARLLLGAQQGPGGTLADVVYDEARFDAVTSPTLEEKQWGDFPSGRTVSFGGRSWRVKGTGYYGPGPSYFGSTASCVWVDAAGRLHLTIQKIGSNWYSTEVALAEPLGYGDYVFTTRGRLDTLDQHAVLGLYIWEYGACYDGAYLWWNPYNEVDIEYSRWNVPGNAIAQFVAQPYDWSGNLSRYNAAFADSEIVSHAFRWLPGRVEFRAWRGGPADEATSTRIHAWTYTGPHIPRPESPRVHLNLWQFNGAPLVRQEVVFDAFTFVPSCPTGDCDVLAVEPPPAGPALELVARPNPFRSSVAVRFVLPRAGGAEVALFDLQGRRVRTLHRGALAAGAHEASWDGRDDGGRAAPAGVYLCRLAGPGSMATRRVVLTR